LTEGHTQKILFTENYICS